MDFIQQPASSVYNQAMAQLKFNFNFNFNYNVCSDPCPANIITAREQHEARYPPGTAVT
jgi:hypothetical protein